MGSKRSSQSEVWPSTGPFPSVFSYCVVIFGGFMTSIIQSQWKTAVLRVPEGERIIRGNPEFWERFEQYQDWPLRDASYGFRQSARSPIVCRVLILVEVWVGSTVSHCLCIFFNYKPSILGYLLKLGAFGTESRTLLLWFLWFLTCRRRWQTSSTIQGELSIDDPLIVYLPMIGGVFYHFLMANEGISCICAWIANCSAYIPNDLKWNWVKSRKKNLKLSFFDINHPMSGISNFIMCCFKSITFIHILDEHAIFELSNLLEFAFFKLVHQMSSSTPIHIQTRWFQRC